VKPISLESPATDLELRRSLRQELAGLAVLFGLTLRQLTRGRRLWILLVLYALPCVLAIILRSLRRPAPPDALEFALVFNLVPHALAPLTALLYAGGMVQDEVEGQTLTYLLLRPLPRWGLYVSKLLATLVLTALLITGSTAALYLAIYWNTPELSDGRAVQWLVQTAAILALGQVGYCGLFGCLGVLTRRTLIAGVVYIAAVEGLLANLEFMVRSLTIVYYERVLAVRWLALPQPVLRDWQKIWRLDPELMPDAGTCVETLVGIGLVATAVAALAFARKEFRMKTPEGS
jgi:ABC-2 type transport system permease protein